MRTARGRRLETGGVYQGRRGCRSTRIRASRHTGRRADETSQARARSGRGTRSDDERREFQPLETHDLDWGPDGNWLKENLLVAAALAERGYDFRLVLGDGGHDGNHGGVILPDALRWLWRPEPA